MTTWKSDPAHSRLGFVVRHITITDISGRFAEFTASVQIGKDDLSDAKFNMAARVAAIDTDVPARDEHLRSADFFEAETYPEITFASSHVQMDGKGEGKIRGALTLHGVTRDVTFSIHASEVVTNPMNNAPTRAFKVWGSIKRSEFGLGPSIPALIVGEEVHVTADVECSPA
ncbi:MAG: hypothetical protein DESF_00454 [Desulfovibrio sp.]